MPEISGALSNLPAGDHLLAQSKRINILPSFWCHPSFMSLSLLSSTYLARQDDPVCCRHLHGSEQEARKYPGR